MKKVVLSILVLFAITANSHAQSLKDLLYSGKLKNDSGTVVRKGDDLSAKIDTTAKKTASAENIKNVKDSITKNISNLTTDATAQEATTTAIAGTAIATTAPKDNNSIWKNYIDSLSASLEKEVLPNKKIKSGTYYVFVEYEIGTDGQVSVRTVIPAPENSFLQNQIKERLTLTAPQMNPVLYNGKPRKSVKKFTFNLAKP